MHTIAEQSNVKEAVRRWYDVFPGTSALSMYSEQADFERHDQEVDAFLNLAESLGQTWPSNGLILDVGGGLGMHAGKLLSRCHKLFITDVINYSASYDGHLLHLLDEKHVRNNRLFDLSKVVLIESDAQRQIFRDAFFDAIISINAFEHIPDPTKAFYEVVRVAKPGALIYLTFDPLWSSPAGGHFHEYVQEPWAHLLWTADKYRAKMQAAGASERELTDFPEAMNRKRLSSFRELFLDAEKRGHLHILAMETWPRSASEEPHTEHPNFKKLLQMGYSEEDLVIRGMRLLARVNYDQTR
jgi:ubiquinone/menaquinone biosynthesis C-methylase UbiE